MASAWEANLLRVSRARIHLYPQWPGVRHTLEDSTRGLASVRVVLIAQRNGESLANGIDTPDADGVGKIGQKRGLFNTRNKNQRGVQMLHPPNGEWSKGGKSRIA